MGLIHIHHFWGPLPIMEGEDHVEKIRTMSAMKSDLFLLFLHLLLKSFSKDTSAIRIKFNIQTPLPLKNFKNLLKYKTIFRTAVFSSNLKGTSSK